MKKKVLVYPCGTEIGLEIYRSLRYSTHYELFGGSDNNDHGIFVYKNIIDGLPFIKDDSSPEELIRFEKIISSYNIDFIYPAMDGVITVLAKNRDLFRETIVVTDSETASVCRSKKKTYSLLDGIIHTPLLYRSIDEIASYPVFVKPDVGQGSVGARIINNKAEMLGIDFNKYVVMEYLPGYEYTVDCFTNADGRLIYSRARIRNRIKNGISVNTAFVDRLIFRDIAEKINSSLHQKGGWFFQLKEDCTGILKLLEVSVRIAGTSALSRNTGANLPLMTLDVFNHIRIDDVSLNDYQIELDRALENRYKISLSYSTVYIDYDDTVVHNGVVNTLVIRFLFQCLNRKIKLILLSKHDGDLNSELRKYRINDVFDEIIHIDRSAAKSDYITNCDCILIDDSYGERKTVGSTLNIPVFDTNMLECLMED